MTSADSPTTSYDESNQTPRPGQSVDSRGDMNVRTEDAVGDDLVLAPGDVIMITITEPGQDLVLEGAHNVTDPRTGMVDDQITGGTGEDILRGHVGDDTLDGAAGNDVITGGHGHDVLSGGQGNDVLITNHGSDAIDGGEGDDLVLVQDNDDDQVTAINAGPGSDLILSTGAQNIEVSNFSADDAIGLGGVFEGGQALSGALSVNEGDLLLALPGGQEIRFLGGAGLLDQMSDLVIDFRPAEQIDASLENVFSGLTQEQITEVYGQASDFSDLVGNLEGWQAAEEAIENIIPKNTDPPEKPTPTPPDPPPALEDPEAGPANPNTDPDDPRPGPQEPGPDPSYPLPDDDDHVPDPPVENPQDYNSASGGGCFVATAAYGDRLHPDVVALRQFRDHYLVRTAAGRGFVRFYWIVGPRLAAVTQPHQLHAAVARVLLTRLVRVLRALGKTDAPAGRRGT
ncbi:hypothetical protein CK240_17195 [Paracoccus salipaludis]|uniref:Calcium-binding protein n=2 Tax=Paracoccus salipaludis TaxID=2032623 RepID=A0A2A2G9R7_9RHOB|nr:hypothetical protein CK240_17195 [Paracoccus salipaludis]